MWCCGDGIVGRDTDRSNVSRADRIAAELPLYSEAEMAAQSRLVPLGAMAKPADSADIILFLASERSRFITGEVVHANGGLYMA